MKVLAINGSPRRDGNTSLLLAEVLKPLVSAGHEAEVVQLGGKMVHGCTACLKCKSDPIQKCHIKNDAINTVIEKMIDADAIIIGSPVYFADVTTEIKALIDCAGYVTRAGGNLLKQKIGAAVIAVRRAGELHAFDSINHFFLINQMIVPGSNYWNIAIGRDKGDVLNDEEGMLTMETLGKNIGWLLQKIHS